jgi:hypothetical protein
VGFPTGHCVSSIERQAFAAPPARQAFESAVAGQELRELNAFQSGLAERLNSYERRRMKMDSETRRLLDEIESLRRLRIRAVESKAKATLDAKSAKASTSETDEDDPEDSPSAQV